LFVIPESEFRFPSSLPLPISPCPLVLWLPICEVTCNHGLQGWHQWAEPQHLSACTNNELDCNMIILYKYIYTIFPCRN
jgi:hypothetical protein